HAGAQAGVAEQVLGGERGPDHVAPGQGGTVAELGEQVAAEQGAVPLLVEDAGVPAVRDVRRVDVADPPAAEVDHLAVGQDARVDTGNEITEPVDAVGDLGGPGVHALPREGDVALI